jgi:hypothetical protein
MSPPFHRSAFFWALPPASFFLPFLKSRPLQS